MHWNIFEQDNYSKVEGYGGCTVGEVWAGTTSPIPDHKVKRSTHFISKWILGNLEL